MRIAFADPSDQSYTPQTPCDGPLGGTQSAAAYLSPAMAARGHEVSLFSRHQKNERIRGVECRVVDPSFFNQLNLHDVVICLTKPVGAWFRRNGVIAPLVLWQHNDISAPIVRLLAEPQHRDAFTATAFVSDCQRERFKDRFDLDGVVMRNAVSPALDTLGPIEPFLDRSEINLIYASAPGRGLDMLLDLFPTIRAAIPEARLRIYSDFGIYQQDGAADDYQVYYELARALPGVEFVGSVSQPVLAEAIRETDVFAYPTSFVETSCIVLMEAARAGCILVCLDRGALKETAQGYGVFPPFIDRRPLICRDVARAVIDEVDKARQNPDAFRRQRAAQIEFFRSTHTWANRAAEWEAWLATLCRP